MKKLIFIFTSIFILYQYSFGFDYIKSYIGDSESILLSGTTAAFSVYATSNSAADSAYFTRYESTITAVVINQDVSASSETFNLNLSTSDTIGELVTRINASTYFTASIVDGCYRGTPSTTTVAGRTDNEGNTEGLQYDATGKKTDNILLSTNAATIYLNATTTNSRYFSAPGRDQKCNVTMIVSTASAKTNTMYLYEGVDVDNTTTLKCRPETDMEQTYPDSAPVIMTENFASEFRVIYSSWVNANDYIQIHKFISK